MVTDTPSFKEAILNRRMLICVFTGFTSGLPLYILIQLVPAWLRTEGVGLAEIGFFTLIGLPYTWKFLWSPVMDRYTLPFLGRRRGWMLVTQLALMASIAAIGFLQPEFSIVLIAYLAAAIAFFSASQDIVLDAYRRELLADNVMVLCIDEPERDPQAPRTIKEAVLEPFREFLGRQGFGAAMFVLAFLFFYKLGDNMATALQTPFFIDVGFTLTQIGVVAKFASLIAVIVGGLVGGLIMIVLTINRALWLFGVVQIVSILGFAALAIVGPNLWMLGFAVAFEYLGVGLGTAALTAFIAKSTNKAFAATQFALFTALASTPRTLAGATTGVIVEHVGWPNFFMICVALAVPGMLLLLKVAPWDE
jgi:PAT family beta-lactamase induction signal transducer AmpG